MRTRLCVGLVAALIAVASCGGGDDAGPTGTTNPGGTSNPGGGTSTTNAINVRNNLFDPNATSVPVGSTVTWTWASDADLHNVTFSDGQKSPDQNRGTYSRTFSSAGTFTYTCTLHAGMNGTITVR